MIQPEIETHRLLLRQFNIEDAEVIQQLAGNKKVSEQTLNIPYPYQDGMAEEWIFNQIRIRGNGTEAIYAITDKNSKRLLGTVGLVSIKGLEAELGYWVGEPYWGKGFCTEATKALVAFAFANLGIVKIVAEHLSSNLASGRVMEKIGMAHVGLEHKPDRNSQIVQIENYELQNT